MGPSQSLGGRCGEHIELSRRRYCSGSPSPFARRRHLGQRSTFVGGYATLGELKTDAARFEPDGGGTAVRFQREFGCSLFLTTRSAAESSKVNRTSFFRHGAIVSKRPATHFAKPRFFVKIGQGDQKYVGDVRDLGDLGPCDIQAPFCSRGVTEKWNETAGLMLPANFHDELQRQASVGNSLPCHQIESANTAMMGTWSL